jgi:hypothetical protein
VTPLRSNNPIIIAFHEWAVLAGDLWRARSWRERLACLIGPPNGGGLSALSVTPSMAHNPDQAVGTRIAALQCCHRNSHASKRSYFPSVGPVTTSRLIGVTVTPKKKPRR